jgi:16S rRNA (guanine966-N2)-methyltransferase
VREALFNVLGGSVAGCSVLDCFAGSGALGIEALSRGAARAVFVEPTHQAVQVLRANLAALGPDAGTRVQVVHKPLEKSLAVLRPAGPFDLWLVDPPFAMVRDGAAMAVLSKMSRQGLLALGGTVVFEYPADQDCPAIEGLLPEDVRHYGDSRVAFYGPSGPQ